MSVTDLEQRIAQLEDIEAIKKLKASYCLHVDHANEPDLACYRVELDLAVPRTIPISMLRDYFNHLCGEMQMDWTLREV